ncbi:hypothetical protein Tco_0826947 [Tanacetum coccineum]
MYIFVTLKHFIEVVQAVIKRASKDGEIVHEYFDGFFDYVMKYSQHAPFEMSDSYSEFIAINSSNSAKSFSSRMVPSMEWRISLPSIDVKDHSFSSNTEIELVLFNSNYCIGTIPIGYWNDQSANPTLILVGLRVLRDNFGYKEYDIRLMLVKRSARALHEKALLKLHGMRKLLGSPGSSSSSSLSKLIGVSESFCWSFGLIGGS